MRLKHAGWHSRGSVFWNEWFIRHVCVQFLLSNEMSPVYDVFEYCLVKADPQLGNLTTCENDLRDSVEERVAKREKWVERANALVKKVEYRKCISQYNPRMEQPEVIPKGCNFILVSTCFLNFNWNDIEFYSGEEFINNRYWLF
jgi:hypothetical protein